MAENIPNIGSVRGPSGAERIKRSINAQPGAGATFQEILQQQQAQQGVDLKFSVHAQNRLIERNIELSMDDRQRLQNGVEQIIEKGGRESLIIMNNNAFLVSAENRTVITAIENDGLKGNVFTNIDSALVIS